ncbi:glycosyltransferase [Sphingomonas crusticola]|uniref:glycosyltransferase n=1 Tax=Sphingomonas crusticola TaxID=1697973 RepID=UPI000E234800|nr:glycosyltransferase [Sphingomonas crusticola]
MRAAIHLHLFYPDVALELIDRVARLGRPDIDVLATFPDVLDADVDRALDRIPGRVLRIETPNRGWDIGPLLHLLPTIREEGYGAVCHLHTKKGDSGYAAEWRAIAYDGLIRDDALVTRILSAFEDHPELTLAGPAALYKSAASHQFGNADILSVLAPRLMAPLYPLADWGFFAGTLFWVRPALLERIAALAEFEGHDATRDGTLAHALERLIGLAPVALGGKIGLVDDEGQLTLGCAPGSPDQAPVIRTLVERAERFVAPLDAELSALIAARNPLVDYIRHGRDADALDPNPYFSTQFYLRVHPDLAAAGVHPFEHYTNHGAVEGRSTGPLFDGAYYRAAYDDVTGDPLRHFVEVGAREGRVAIPISRPEYQAADDRPRRFYRHFDVAGEAAFLRRIAGLPPKVVAAAAATRVSVVMPAWNREATIAAAIRSVLSQTHENLELIVADDGSTDETRAAVAPFLGDPRVRWLDGPHGGVSAARNRGLAAATGDIVAYLDSDNRWMGWFLEVMTRFMTAERVDAAYSAIALRDDLGHLTGYRGDDFDWEACLSQNYVDLNAFCHRRALIETVGAFDPRLRRMVDWDLILRVGKNRNVGYAPFVGCDYHDGKADPGRITTAEPAAFQKLVWTKNRFELEVGSPAFLERLKLSFAIKIAAPEHEKDAWGDWHFADSLAEAIRRLGHDVHVDFRGRWGGRALADEDVAISLRGLIAYEPRPGQLAYLWNISHPDQVSYEEYDRYSRVYVASESYAGLLDHIVRPPVSALLQATDPDRFHPLDNPPAGPDLLFVGNSRGIEREIVRWAIEAERPPAIYGGGWEGLVSQDLVKADNVDNRVLGAMYAGAGAVLNDHWPSMAAFGLLSNRLFDIVAAGGKALSDRVPSIARTFGSAVAEVSGPAELQRVADRLVHAPRVPGAAEAVMADHSFDARARRLVGDTLTALGLAPPFAVPPQAPPPLPTASPLPKSIRIHLIVAHGPHGPQSSATIRLIAPLTHETVTGRARISVGGADTEVPQCDICIVQRAALPSEAAVDMLVARLAELGAALVVDVDDAFVAMEDHPEAALYRPLNAAIERAIAASAETWFSTSELARLYTHVAHRHAIMPNALDPRIWRDWRQHRPEPFREDVVRMLYMGTGTHGSDFALIRPALEQLAEERPGRFELTLIGIAADIEPASWLRRQSPPAEVIPYARFVRWLRAQGPYDAGLAPLADTRFNRAKSDIKLLDYAALGMLPVVQDCDAYRVDRKARDVALYASDWLETLRQVVDDRDTARARAAGAQSYVWQHRSIAGRAAPMIARLEALL